MKTTHSFPSQLLFVSFFLICLSSLSSIAQADISYSYTPEANKLDYDYYFRGAVYRADLSSLRPTGPYSLQLFSKQSSATLLLTSPVTTGDVKLFTQTSTKLRSQTLSRVVDLYSLRGGLSYRASKYVDAVVMFNLDRARAVDPFYEGKKWRGLAGDIEQASLYLNVGQLRVTMGREQLFWSVRPVNLFISASAEPLDLFRLQYQKGRLGFEFFFARLDASRPDSVDILRLSNDSFNDNRYLVGHRIDITIRHNLRLSLIETVTYGGEGRPAELYYLNPLQFFHTAQLNQDQNDNTMLGGEVSWLPRRGLHLYGQLLVDDFQIEKKSHGDQEPNEIGVVLGIFKTNGGDTYHSDLRLEYTKISNRTYHQREPRNRYLYKNRSLGHSLGADADSLSASVKFWLKQDFSFEIETALTRHGEGSIYNSWDEPWSTSTSETYSEPFPTGIVQQSRHLAVYLKGYVPFNSYLSRHLFVSLGAGSGSFKNERNMSGVNNVRSWITFGITWVGSAVLRMGE